MPLTHRTSASTLRLRRRAASRTLAVALATSLALACAPAAHASGRSYTVSSDGTTVTVTGTAGVDDISVARHYDGRVTVHDAEPGPGCELFYPDDDRSPAVCPVGPGGIQVNALGGNDRVSATVWGDPALSLGDFRIDLGDGNDAFSAQKVDGPVTVRGGAGADTIEGSRQGDDLDGGPGNDTIEGYWGADIIHGGEGDDQVIGDEGGQRAGDLIDGGPGLDRTDDWLDAEDAASITLDGKANDGFADEADNVVSVEKIRMGAAATFTGDDGVNVVVSGEVAGSAVLLGFGGNDELSGGDRSDRIEGGAGAD
jgi:Ca2+-binding RTX toxin-like protein